jgi:hypothetical protein
LDEKKALSRDFFVAKGGEMNEKGAHEVRGTRARELIRQ